MPCVTSRPAAMMQWGCDEARVGREGAHRDRQATWERACKKRQGSMGPWHTAVWLNYLLVPLQSRWRRKGARPSSQLDGRARSAPCVPLQRGRGGCRLSMRYVECVGGGCAPRRVVHGARRSRSSCSSHYCSAAPVAAAEVGAQSADPSQKSQRSPGRQQAAAASGGAAAWSLPACCWAALARVGCSSSSWQWRPRQCTLPLALAAILLAGTMVDQHFRKGGGIWTVPGLPAAHLPIMLTMRDCLFRSCDPAMAPAAAVRSMHGHLKAHPRPPACIWLAWSACWPRRLAASRPTIVYS